MKKFLLGVLIGLLFAGFGLVIVVFALARIGSRPPSIPSNGVLVYRLEGDVPEAPGIEIPLPFFQSNASPTVRDHWENLRKAAADSRVRAVLFLPQGVNAGWGKIEEIRSDLEALRKSGKPVYAYLRAPRARDYYMASAAERIYMAPEDFLDLKGLRAELLYLKGTLDKVGVQIEIEHAGKYKDAGDTFTRTSASPETLEVMNSILDDLYGQLVERLARARHKSPEQVRGIIDQGPFTAQQALASGLVDTLQYQDQVYDELKQRLKLTEVKKIALRDYLKVTPESLGLETGARVALVAAEGDIVRGDVDTPFGNEGFITSPGMTRLLQQVGRDNTIRGVIVRINSPGGDGFASDEIWREMKLLSAKKPVVISMSDLAASGGYYMAMTGDPVLAYPGTLTGSIGVFYGKADLHGLYEKLGIHKQVLSRGRFAEIDSDSRPLTDAEKQKLQGSIQDFYRTFVDRVATGRKRPFNQVESLAQGRVWLGSQAKSNGLIDQYGGLDEAIATVRQKARLRADEKVRLVAYPPRRTIFDQLFGQRQSVSLLDTRLTSLARRFSTHTWLEGGFFKMMPYSIEIK